MKMWMQFKNWVDRLPYWYGSLDESEQWSMNAMGFVVGISLAFGLLMPSWSHASGCPVERFDNLSDVQVQTLEVCADLAFKDSSEIYAESGPLTAYSFISYRVGWCVYHELYPNHGQHQYHEWLECRNQANGLEYFF